jgi:hypothetical protein
MANDCISEKLNYLPYLVSLGVVQEEILYVKSHKVKEIILFLTDSHQTLLGNFLDVVQEEILYVKSHKLWEIIQSLTL